MSCVGLSMSALRVLTVVGGATLSAALLVCCMEGRCAHGGDVSDLFVSSPDPHAVVSTSGACTEAGCTLEGDGGCLQWHSFLGGSAQQPDCIVAFATGDGSAQLMTIYLPFTCDEPPTPTRVDF